MSNKLSLSSYVLGRMVGEIDVYGNNVPKKKPKPKPKPKPKGVKFYCYKCQNYLGVDIKKYTSCIQCNTYNNT